MTILPFGRFAPSLADHEPDLCDAIMNVIPMSRGYRPFPQLMAVSDALPSKPIGAIQAVSPAGLSRLFAATQTALWRLDTTSIPYGWDEVTNGALSMNLSGESAVDFVVFGSKVIAFNAGMLPQIADIETGSFTTLAGSPGTSAYGIEFKDRVWGLNQSSANNRIEWSGINDQTFWQPNKRGSDFQSFPDGGPVRGAFKMGGVLYVFQEDAIRVVQYVGGAFTFSILPIQEEFGTPSHQTIVSTPSGGFFLAESGFHAVAGGAVQDIGADSVNEWFRDTQVDLAKLWAVQGAHDPVNKLALWRYATPGHAADGYTNKMIGFHYGLGRWFPVSLDCSWIFRAESAGLSLDSDFFDDLDNLDINLDSRIYDGGRPQLAGFTSDWKLGFFTGSPMAATLETADVQMRAARRSHVRGFRLRIEGTPSYTGQIGTKEHYTADRRWRDAVSPNRAEVCTCHADGLLHRNRFNLAAGENWNVATGVEITDSVASGGGT